MTDVLHAAGVQGYSSFNTNAHAHNTTPACNYELMCRGHNCGDRRTAAATATITATDEAVPSRSYRRNHGYSVSQSGGERERERETELG